LASSDVVNGKVPITLGGVSVKIDSQDAFIYYISPTQINVLSPSDNNTGSIAVAVTNSAGTSPGATAVLQPELPGLFVASNYVRAVRVSDGAIINGTGAAETGYVTAAAASSGDALELFGTGFGAATGAPDTGTVFTGAYPTINAVSVTIGGVAAPVSFAGLVGPGLYQINITVPAGLPAGDKPILAMVNSMSSASTALLKIG
jgi:uncharacterized protein (TIGR03437 family)